VGAASVALIDNPLRFQWQYYDEETGLHYNRFRYYSPRLGRYWSVDPIGLVAGHNLYSYVGNDPVNRTDPLGLWWEAALSVVAGVAVAALIVATAPVSLPMLAVAALSGAVVALGVHDGITQYQNTGHICVQCIIEGALTTVVIGAAIAVVAAVAAPEVAAVVVGVAIAAGIESLADTIINWDNLNHDDRMKATGGVIGGVIFGAAARAYQGLRGLFKGGGAAAEENTGPKTTDTQSKNLDDIYGAPQEPKGRTGIKDFEKTPDGVVKNPTIQYPEPGKPPVLEPGKEYIWLVDEQGRLVVAEEVPTGKNQPDGRPERLGHPTLVDGKLARIGGEIKPSVRRDY
jgi:RHS repeat-associated protein